MDTPRIPAKGEQCSLRIESLAHGGEGIGHLDGRVVFVQGGLPGDLCTVEFTQVKKAFAKAVAVEIIEPSTARVAQRCPAADRGAGCCDFGELDPAQEADFKVQVVLGQLSRLARLEVPRDSVRVLNLGKATGWRTRMRLGSNAKGEVGMRKAKSRDVIPGVICAQAVPELHEAIAALGRVTPGAEVVAARGDNQQVSIVEVRPAPRGKRSERVERVLQGTPTVQQRVKEVDFTLPATAFWQAHEDAAETYAEFIEEHLRASTAAAQASVAWDLYGGVGVFAPAIANACPQASIHSVEVAAEAADAGKAAMASTEYAQRVKFHTGDVEKLVATLPAPQVVVLDPPRTGAGTEVVSAIAQQRPEIVIHIGCDAATFARDLGQWAAGGYEVSEMAVVDAFPGTHHCEAIAVLRPARTNDAPTAQ